MIHMELYPLKFENLYKDRIWGGRNLERYLNKPLPPGDARIGESWEVADHRSETSVVANGPLKGATLRRLREEFGEELVGAHGLELGRGQLPLLIKFLDAQDVLSAQVHPDDEYAALHENGELGKTEMWYVIHAEPGAKLILGLKPGTTRETLKAAIEAGTAEDLFNQIEVRSGECYFTPAGRVHAIGAGNLICEVQQNSDVTYRLYDWNRKDAHGHPRELHVEKSLDVIDYEDTDIAPVRPQLLHQNGGKVWGLICCRYFVAEKLEVSGVLSGDTRNESFHVLSAFSGEGEVRGGERDVPLRKGESLLIPCALGEYEIRSESGLEILRSYVPPKGSE
jgi:mannose-6-phosphate isomerase